MQTKLDEEESKNMKLQQQINKLEHHSAQIQEVREQYNVGLHLSVSMSSCYLPHLNYCITQRGQKRYVHFDF